MTVLVADDAEFGVSSDAVIYMAQFAEPGTNYLIFSNNPTPAKDGNYGIRTVNTYGYTIPARSEIFMSYFQLYEGGIAQGTVKMVTWRSAGVELGSIRYNFVTQRAQLHLGTSGTATVVGANIIPSSAFGGAIKNFQLRIKIDNSVGSIQFKYEGFTPLEIDYDIQDTQPGADTTINEIVFGNSTVSGHRADNIWINDTNGTYNNTWPGIVRASSQYPTGVGSLSDFISSTAGSKYTEVDEQPISTTDYVYSETIGDEQQFTYPAPVIPANSEVLAVAVYNLAYKVSEGDIIHGLQINGDSDLSAQTALNTGFFTGSGRAYYSEQNPDTVVAWEPTDNPNTYFKHEA